MVDDPETETYNPLPDASAPEIRGLAALEVPSWSVASLLGVAPDRVERWSTGAPVHRSLALMMEIMLRTFYMNVTEYWKGNIKNKDGAFVTKLTVELVFALQCTFDQNREM